MFVGGWSRHASEGLVGIARKDGINAAKAVEQYLQTIQPITSNLGKFETKMKSLPGPVITNDEIKKLEAVEDVEAQKRGMEEFKFASNEDMLQAIGLAEATV